MKKIFTLVLILSLFGIAIAAELQPIAFPFIGRWSPTEDPTLLDDYGLQDIQNVRKWGKHFKGIDGHTTINSTTLSAYPYFFNGFHFRKDQPQESHVLVVAANNVASNASYLYQNTNTIPGTGNFAATVVHTDASGGEGKGRFSVAPQGNLVYSNGAETLIWGGNEIEPVAFIASNAALTGTSSVISNPNDYSAAVRTTRTTVDQVATISSGGGLDSYTMLLLQMNGTNGSFTFTDSSLTTPHTVNAANNTVSANISTSAFKFGGASGSFNGAQYLTTADDDDFDFSGGIWTVDFWVNKSFLNQNITVYYQESAANNYCKIELINTASGFTFYPRLTVVSPTGTVVTVSATSTCYISDWYHVAFVQNGTSYYGFVNGALITSVTDSDTPTNYTGSVYIGSNATPSAYHKGYLDEFRISKGVARWTAAFTPYIKAYGFDSPYWFVGFTRPIQGAKFYIADPNVVASTMTGKEWNGVAWSDLTITDNTSATSISLAQTGTVTFTSTENTSKPKYINGLSLYWYQFNLSAGSATIYYATVDAPMQAIRNIWDGAKRIVAKCLKYDGTIYTDYTSYVIDLSLTTSLDVSSLTTSGHFLLGFAYPQQGFKLDMVVGSENTAANSAMTVSYWNGAAWTATTALYDGTATSTTALNKGGVVSFQPTDAGSQFQKTISDELPIYYYKISFAATLGANTKIGEISGIEAPPPMSSYSFSETFRRRLFLFNELSGERNAAPYSAFEAPDIFNGSDSGKLYFGDKTDVISAIPVFNIFRTGAADQLIVAKKNETYRLTGDSPSTWVVERISFNTGCVAPLSMVSCDISDAAESGVTRQVAIWQSDKGFVMTDGAAVIPISDDIRCYFDPNDSRYIPTTRQSKTVAWYDPAIKSYKALISSGSGVTSHNVELEYSLQYKEWTKIYRVDGSGADPLQCGFRVFDTTGIGYTYGGNTKGNLYRLENSATFAGTAIASILHTKDLILDTQVPLFRKSTVKFMRTALKKKTSGGTVTIAHYGDQTLTVTATNNQVVPAAFTVATAPYNTQSCALGPFLYHSFKITSSQSVAGGMELNGLAIYAEPYLAMR